MDRVRGWRLAVVGVAVLAAAGLVAFVVASGDGNGGASVATNASTTSTRSVESTSSTSTPTAELPALPSSTASTAAPAAATTAGTATTAPANTVPAAPCPRPAPGSDFDGFGATSIVIENAEGSHRSCVLTADTPAQRERGLMRQDDLDSYDGMIFRFPSEEERAFWMRNTSIPLSIAFFNAGGAFVSATDMEPCGDSAGCPTYSSYGAAKYALEVLKGRLPAVGATAGSRLIG